MREASEAQIKYIKSVVKTLGIPDPLSNGKISMRSASAFLQKWADILSVFNYLTSKNRLSSNILCKYGGSAYRGKREICYNVLQPYIRNVVSTYGITLPYKSIEYNPTSTNFKAEIIIACAEYCMNAQLKNELSPVGVLDGVVIGNARSITQSVKKEDSKKSTKGKHLEVTDTLFKQFVAEFNKVSGRKYPSTSKGFKDLISDLVDTLLDICGTTSKTSYKQQVYAVMQDVNAFFYGNDVNVYDYSTDAVVLPFINTSTLSCSKEFRETVDGFIKTLSPDNRKTFQAFALAFHVDALALIFKNTKLFDEMSKFYGMSFDVLGTEILKRKQANEKGVTLLAKSIIYLATVISFIDKYNKDAKNKTAVSTPKYRGDIGAGASISRLQVEKNRAKRKAIANALF